MKTLYTNANVYNTGERRFELSSIAVENGKFASIDNTDQIIDCGGAYIMPGLVDAHTHGRIGYAANNATPDEFIELSRSYAKTGTTSYMPTLSSVSVEAIEGAIGNISKAMEIQNDFTDGANILGVHFEGRYLNKNRRGAHDVKMLSNPSAEEIEKFVNRARGENFPIERFHVICAPELEGAEGFIKKAVSMGATVSIGHSAATFDECKKGVEWGARSFTHLYNAMSPLTHREAGCVGAAMTFTNTYAEMVTDGYHVSPEVVKITSKIIELSRLVLITDSVIPAGLPAGEYPELDGGTVYTDGKICKQPDGTISGSVIDLFTGLWNFVNFTGISLEDAIPCATINPARMIKADDIIGSIELGKYADFIVLSDDKKAVKSVYVRGNKI